jgi:hypothetical protein
VPKHDPDAIDWALSEAQKVKPQTLILLGDLADFNALSRFPKSPEQQLGLEAEMEECRAIVKRINKLFRSVRIVFLLGNHCDRPKKYLWRSAPALSDVPELAAPALMGVPSRWMVVPYKHAVIEQDVLVQHGTRWGKGTCAANLADFGMSSAQGHSHRANLMSRSLPNGKVITAVEAGCLCQLDMEYAPLNNWTHAMAVIHAGKLELLLR